MLHVLDCYYSLTSVDYLFRQTDGSGGSFLALLDGQKFEPVDGEEHVDLCCVADEGGHMLRVSYCADSGVIGAEDDRLNMQNEEKLYVLSAGLAAALERSEPLEGEVLEEPEHSLPPHQEDCRSPQLQDAVVDQPHGVPKRTEEVNEESLHLRLASFQPLGVL